MVQFAIRRDPTKCERDRSYPGRFLSDGRGCSNRITPLKRAQGNDACRQGRAVSAGRLGLRWFFRTAADVTERAKLDARLT